jgi:hypothetical protein
MTTDPEVTVRGFKKCCIYAEMEDKEKAGNVGVNVTVLAVNVR